LLFLDEPTSGLDPGYEKSVMALLRDLADGGRSVIVITHSIQSLKLCDWILFLAPGGFTAYAALAAITVVCLALASVALYRRDPLRSRRTPGARGSPARA